MGHLVERYIHDHLAEHPDPSQHDLLLADAISEANRAILALGEQDEAKRGLGSTFLALWFHGDRVLFASVGDSRIYLLRDQNLTQLSADEKAGRYRLAASLGHEETVDPQIGMVYLRRGDRFLLCTDGLHGPVSHSKLLYLLATEISPAHCCRRLIDKANKKGGPDNITALVADVAEPEPRQPWHFSRARHDATSFHARVQKFNWWLWMGLAAVLIVAILAWALSVNPAPSEPDGPGIGGRIAVLAKEANAEAAAGDDADAQKALEDLIQEAIRQHKSVALDELGLSDQAAPLLDAAAEAVWTRHYRAAIAPLDTLRDTPAETYAEAALDALRERTQRVRGEFRQGDFRGTEQFFRDLAAESAEVLKQARQDLAREKGGMANAIAVLRQRAREYEPTNAVRQAVERRCDAAETALGANDLTAAEKAVKTARAILEGRQPPDAK